MQGLERGSIPLTSTNAPVMEWQTCQSQKLVPVRVWRFKSSLGYQYCGLALVSYRVS